MGADDVDTLARRYVDAYRASPLRWTDDRRRAWRDLVLACYGATVEEQAATAWERCVAVAGEAWWERVEEVTA